LRSADLQERLGVLDTPLWENEHGPFIAGQFGLDRDSSPSQPEERVPPPEKSGGELNVPNPVVASHQVREFMRQYPPPTHETESIDEFPWYQQFGATERPDHRRRQTDHA
jgi:hypothetical protein